MTFGERLKSARLKMGFTQEQLAELIGVAKTTLTGYEKGNREPDVFKIKRLIEVLNIDSDYLLGIEEKVPLFSAESLQVASAYEKADAGIQTSVRKLLDIDDAEKSESEAVG